MIGLCPCLQLDSKEEKEEEEGRGRTVEEGSTRILLGAGEGVPAEWSVLAYQPQSPSGARTA